MSVFTLQVDEVCTDPWRSLCGSHCRGERHCKVCHAGAAAAVERWRFRVRRLGAAPESGARGAAGRTR